MDDDFPAGLLPVAVEMESDPRWRLRPDEDQIRRCRIRGGDASLLIGMTFRTRMEAERASFTVGDLIKDIP